RRSPALTRALTSRRSPTAAIRPPAIATAPSGKDEPAASIGSSGPPATRRSACIICPLIRQHEAVRWQEAHEDRRSRLEQNGIGAVGLGHGQFFAPCCTPVKDALAEICSRLDAGGEDVGYVEGCSAAEPDACALYDPDHGAAIRHRSAHTYDRQRRRRLEAHMFALRCGHRSAQQIGLADEGRDKRMLLPLVH